LPYNTVFTDIAVIVNKSEISVYVNLFHPEQASNENVFSQ